MKTQKTMLNVLALVSAFAVVTSATAGLTDLAVTGKNVASYLISKSWRAASNAFAWPAGKAVKLFDRAVGTELTGRVSDFAMQHGNIVTGSKFAAVIAALTGAGYYGFKKYRNRGSVVPSKTVAKKAKKTNGDTRSNAAPENVGLGVQFKDLASRVNPMNLFSGRTDLVPFEATSVAAEETSKVEENPEITRIALRLAQFGLNGESSQKRVDEKAALRKEAAKLGISRDVSKRVNELRLGKK